MRFSAAGDLVAVEGDGLKDGLKDGLTGTPQDGPTLQQRYGLTPVVNAAGTFTPLGVSRSSSSVAAAVAEALQGFYVIDELQAVLSRAVADATGAEAAVLTHCVAAAVTLATAAAMAGCDPARVHALPNVDGLPNRVVVPAGHAIDYGHPLLTDIRLAGALPVLAGSEQQCSPAQLEAALAGEHTAALLLVSSRLVRGEPVDLRTAVDAAHRRGVPAIIDGAAQDLRIDALLATGADAVLLSAHKYLASPTAGLVLGRAAFVAAFRAQEHGIGRATKASKEALVGVLAALAERQQLDGSAWGRRQAAKVERMVELLQGVEGLQVGAVPDPAGMPFARVRIHCDRAAGPDAALLANRLKAGTPSIRVMEHQSAQGCLLLELVPLEDDECALIADRISEAVRTFSGTGRAPQVHDAGPCSGED